MALSQTAGVYESPRRGLAHRHQGFGFVLFLAALMLGLVVVSVFFPPAIVDGGIGNETWLAGP
jgi:hypothetical protein